MDKPIKKRPKLYIVNLQWTPKDDHSTLKINGNYWKKGEACIVISFMVLK